MLARTHTDYPRLRAHKYCAHCGKPKPISALLCWRCFNMESQEGHIGPHAQANIERTEANLGTAARFAAEFPKIAAAMEAGR